MGTVNYTPGRFVWHELLTRDLDKARAFYGGLIDWSFNTSKMGDIDYVMIKAGDIEVGGMLVHPDVPPAWVGYVSVPNVEETVEAAKANGGQALTPIMDIPIGKFAMLQDPQGGVFSAWRAHEGDQAEVERPELHTFCWDQLNATNLEQAETFYAKVLGWKAEDFGPGGGLRVFKRGERQAASAMQAPQGVPTHWLEYVVVEDLAATRSKVTGLGGKVLHEEQSIPGIGSFSVIQDDQGATLALFQPASA